MRGPPRRRHSPYPARAHRRVNDARPNMMTTKPSSHPLRAIVFFSRLASLYSSLSYKDTNKGAKLHKTYLNIFFIASESLSAFNCREASKGNNNNKIGQETTSPDLLDMMLYVLLQLKCEATTRSHVYLELLSSIHALHLTSVVARLLVHVVTIAEELTLQRLVTKE